MLLHAAVLTLLAADPSTLMLTANGEVEIAATDVRLTGHLETIARDQPKANDACEGQLKELMAQLEKVGVESKDVFVADSGSGAAYDEDGRPSRFAARRTISVALHRLDRAAPVAALFNKGGKTLFLQSAYFSVERLDDIEVRALAAAAQRARKAGEAIASELGVRLSRVQRVQELSFAAPSPVQLNGPGINLANLPPKLKSVASLQVIFELDGSIGAPRTASNQPLTDPAS